MASTDDLDVARRPLFKLDLGQLRELGTADAQRELRLRELEAREELAAERELFEQGRL